MDLSIGIVGCDVLFYVIMLRMGMNLECLYLPKLNLAFLGIVRTTVSSFWLFHCMRLDVVNGLTALRCLSVPLLISFFSFALIINVILIAIIVILYIIKFLFCFIFLYFSAFL
jgi:hypothetical protein